MEYKENSAQEVLDYFKSLGLELHLKSYEFEDESYGKINLSAPTEIYEKSQNLLYNDNFLIKYNINISQEVPKLVGAKVGDLVLLFDKYSTIESESEIAIVSDINSDGKYSCHYIKMVFGDRFTKTLSCFHEFYITKDDYGGLHDGFLKILSYKDLINLFEIKIKKMYEQELKRVESQKYKTQKGLPKLVEFLKTIDVKQKTYLDLETNYDYNVGVEK